MADGTHISWAEATWNPITGCSVYSPGCRSCYAMRLAGTRMKHHPSRKGLTIDTPNGPVWTGEVRFNEQWLDQPLRWRKPRMIFVVAHGDLFHEAVPDEWIDRIFAVMALAPQHIFQVLTKRAERMRGYAAEFATPGRIGRHLHTTAARTGGNAFTLHQAQDRLINWPLPNVWKGVSVEDQKRADERIPNLLATPAALRWISAEPSLGPIDLRNLVIPRRYGSGLLDAFTLDFKTHHQEVIAGPPKGHGPLDWVVAGGESQGSDRPSHPQWFRDIRDQCVAACVPFHFKQWGDWAPRISGRSIAPDGSSPGPDKWNDPSTEWMERVGARAAGRKLDGKIWNEFPERRPA